MVPRGANLAQAVLSLEPQELKKPGSSPGVNHGYPPSGASGDVQRTKWPDIVSLSQIDKEARVNDDAQSDRPLEKAGIQGTLAKFLPTRVFSRDTNSLLEKLSPI